MCGHDGLSNEMIKLCAPIISPFLAQGFNKGIEDGTFPDLLENSKNHSAS